MFYLIFQSALHTQRRTHFYIYHSEYWIIEFCDVPQIDRMTLVPARITVLHGVRRWYRIFCKTLKMKTSIWAHVRTPIHSFHRAASECAFLRMYSAAMTSGNRPSRNRSRLSPRHKFANCIAPRNTFGCYLMYTLSPEFCGPQIVIIVCRALIMSVRDE